MRQCMMSSFVPPCWLTWEGETRNGVRGPVVTGADGFLTKASMEEVDLSSSILSDNDSIM